MLLLGGCAGGHRGLTGAALGSLAVDWSQTSWRCTDPGWHRRGAWEDNPVLGPRPGRATVALYMGAWAGALVGAHVWLPRWASVLLDVGVVSVELYTVPYNLGQGDRLGY